MFDYVRDPAEIYRQSFAAIRSEADLSAVEASLEAVAVRLIHACGLPDLAPNIVGSEGAALAGRRAMALGAPILCDVEMVSHGITRARLPKENAVVCRLNEGDVPDRARAQGTTRSAAQLDHWIDQLAGAVVAIGNAPTALFRLLELLADGAPKPAIILGFPVGFVGAAESKQALIDHAGDVPFITLKGRFGGSALAAAAVNALASEVE